MNSAHDPLEKHNFAFSSFTRPTMAKYSSQKRKKEVKHKRISALSKQRLSATMVQVRVHD